VEGNFKTIRIKIMERIAAINWRLLVTILFTLSISSSQTIAESQITPQEQAILTAIAKAHGAPLETVPTQDKALTKEQETLPDIDPTKPADFLFTNNLGSTALPEEKAEKHLMLTAIFVGKARKVAVINGTLVKEGATIAGKKVQEITEDTVKLIENREVLELKLPITFIKEAS
jgi:hypothetical protein